MLVNLAAALSLILAVAMAQGAAAQVVMPDTRIEVFQMAPGESQTHDMEITLPGIGEVSVTSVRFSDGEMAQWTRAERDVPFSVSTWGLGEDVQIVIPITITVPASYAGAGGEVSAHIDLSYNLDGQPNEHAMVHEFTIIVDQPPEIWPVFGIGAAIAAAGALYSLYRQRKHRQDSTSRDGI